MPTSTWDTSRPKITDDGGWGVDTTEPVVKLLLEFVPPIWQFAADFGGAVFNDIPAVLDDVTREALVTDAASRVSTPFRRRILRKLGPYALLPDSALDALTDAEILERFPQIGRWDAGKEARALIRGDIERLLALKSSVDKTALFDDLLLLACSEWVNDRARIVTMICGILVTFRSPVTKHVPVLAGLMGGLWDLWRNRTLADQVGETSGGHPAVHDGPVGDLRRQAAPRGGRQCDPGPRKTSWRRTTDLHAGAGGCGARRVAGPRAAEALHVRVWLGVARHADRARHACGRAHTGGDGEADADDDPASGRTSALHADRHRACRSR